MQATVIGEMSPGEGVRVRFHDDEASHEIGGRNCRLVPASLISDVSFLAVWGAGPNGLAEMVLSPDGNGVEFAGTWPTEPEPSMPGIGSPFSVVVNFTKDGVNFRSDGSVIQLEMNRRFGCTAI